LLDSGFKNQVSGSMNAVFVPNASALEQHMLGVIGPNPDCAANLEAYLLD
jgi:hypothetical protein